MDFFWAIQLFKAGVAKDRSAQSEGRTKEDNAKNQERMAAKRSAQSEEKTLEQRKAKDR